MTECALLSFEFTTVRGRQVQARFAAGHVTSDGGSLLLRHRMIARDSRTERALQAILRRRFRNCQKSGNEFWVKHYTTFCRSVRQAPSADNSGSRSARLLDPAPGHSSARRRRTPHGMHANSGLCPAPVSLHARIGTRSDLVTANFAWLFSGTNFQSM